MSENIKFDPQFVLDSAKNMIAEKNYVEASQYLKLIDNPEADFLLATMIEELPEEIKKHFAISNRFELLLKASVRGSYSAMKLLGDCYLENDKFHVRDEKKAFSWYSKAYLGGNQEAIEPLIRCYREGIGTTNDFSMVVRLKKELEKNQKNENK